MYLLLLWYEDIRSAITYSADVRTLSPLDLNSNAMFKKVNSDRG